MSERTVKLPDVGEGIAEAELVEWHVKVGDTIREDDLIAAVMTDKATVEIPSPVSGEVVWVGAQVGDVVAIGSTLIRVGTSGKALSAPPEPAAEAAPAKASDKTPVQPSAAPRPAVGMPAKSAPPALPKRAAAEPSPAMRVAAPAGRPAGSKPVASPAVRFAAREAGIDLRQVPGSGPAGRITHGDLESFLARADAPPEVAARQARTEVTDIKVVGLRRRIAERMALSKSRIPHITIVEELDVTALEDLRGSLNTKHGTSRPKLTVLPFLMRAMVKALGEYPALNALYDDDAGVVHRHAGIHIGIATQTPGGLLVPVVKHVEARGLWDCAAELGRMAELARTGTAGRDELTGSTVTITSLGALGALATTPVINYPEVAIVGVNRMAVRPMWDGKTFVPRKMMNLSSSFDHRVIDGWDAAVFVQRLKELLEMPAIMFIDE